MTNWIDACATDDIDQEDLIRFDHAGATYAIYHAPEGDFYCTSGLCTHENVHLADGLVMENTIECPKHSSIFDFTTGEVETPPACNNLHCYKTKVEGGRVLVDI